MVNPQEEEEEEEEEEEVEGTNVECGRVQLLAWGER